MFEETGAGFIPERLYVGAELSRSVVWVAFVALAHKNDHVVERQWVLFSRGQVVEELVDSGLLVSKTALTRNNTETEPGPVGGTQQ